MLKNWDIAKILSRTIEGKDPESIDRVAKMVVKNFPEKAPLILRALKEAEEFDENHVSLTSARHLNDEEKEEAKSFIVKFFGDVSLEFKVARDIIGGVIIQKGETIIDNSLRSRMKQVLENIKINY